MEFVDTAGWTSLKNLAVASQVTLDVQAKVAAGNEGGTTIQATTSGNQDSSCLFYVIENWEGTIASVEASTGVAIGTGTTTPDPDSLTASWGAEDNLWLALLGMDGQKTTTSYPTSYDSLTTGHTSHATATPAAVSGATTAVGVRENNTATEDPGTFTMDTGDQYCACTVVVRPAAAGGGSQVITRLAGPGGMVGPGGLVGPGLA